MLSIINSTLNSICHPCFYPHVFHKDTMPYICTLISSFQPLLACSSQVQAYDLISYDMSCNLSHMPLHHQKEKENQKKRNIKSRKIDKRKRKILVFKHTITLIIFVNQFTMTTITSYPFNFGNSSIISMLISYQGPSGNSNRCSSPAFFMCCTLFCWYLIYS